MASVEKTTTSGVVRIVPFRFRWHGASSSSAGTSSKTCHRGDLYVVKNVLLDWDDERALRILANCHAAAAQGAMIWVIETLLPEPPATSWVNLLDINALALVGGRNRTHSEYQRLLDRAGFEPGQVTEIRTPPTPNPQLTTLQRLERRDGDKSQVLAPSSVGAYYARRPG